MKVNNICIGQTKNNGCKRLTVNKCSGENCSFIQTRKQLEESNKYSFNRLSSLNKEHQVYIADKYYGGLMPWDKGGERR